MKTRNPFRFHHWWLTAVLPAVVILATACGPGLPATGSAAPADWPQANHDLANTRVATGSPILSSNVKQLGVDWTVKVTGVSQFGAISTSPIVVGNRVYFQDLKSNVYAVDLGRGKPVWHKRYDSA